MEQVVRALGRAGLVAPLLFLWAHGVVAQTNATPESRHYELFGLPALNFNSDEGFGYGALLEIYNYAPGAEPYRFMLRPLVLFTTKGRRDVTLWFDAPKLLPNDWRLDVNLAREQQLATPYYGVGNDAPFNEQLEQSPNTYYYRYGRTILRIAANLQHKLGTLPARGLLGLGFSDVKTTAIPFNQGTSLLAQQLGAAAAPTGRIALVRAGMVWDSRNREIAPRSGTYGDLLVQRVDRALGATSSYTRFTGILRRYYPLGEKLVFAQRLLAQQTSGNVPLFDLPTIQTSFQDQDGLGGNNSVRGLPKDRFIGKGIALVNSELRWRFKEFEVKHKAGHLVASAFVDAGRVWTQRIGDGSAGPALHAGYGGGLRVGLGPSFVVALDVGHSSEATAIYIGLGYPF